MIDGARRVGKSYIVEEFAKNEYKSYILIDFSNENKEIKALFTDYISDLDTLFRRLSLLTDVRLHHRESVIVFDEVELFPPARAAIKHLVKDGRYDYIETGSLVSINRNVKDIVIPSEEERIDMFPIDFEEFLWAKCNNIQVDGISFIEKLSFNAFNEGTRLQHCVKMHKRLFGVKVKKIGGDTSYAGKENRDFCKKESIQTSFVKRGRPSKIAKEKDFVRQELARVRATTMEGSFGTQKEHYSMRKIKARKKETEILYIFFGIHTANAVLLAERLMEQQHAKAA